MLRAMYAKHFGLKELPFSIAPNPRYLFMSERHREALAHLLYGVRGGGGFVVLTGDVGAGKTTVCRCLLEQLPPRCNVAYIFNPKMTVEELLKSVCAEFRISLPHEGRGTSTLKDYVDALNVYLLRAHSVAHNNVLIIDEAQNLSDDVLEQLRLLTNLETNERKLLQIVLIGQPELRAILARPGMRQLAQRVIARYHLGALTEKETAQYVLHRLAVAGLSRPAPFDGRTMRRVYRHSHGVPRRINLLCDRALLGAYAKGKAGVDRGTLLAAAREVFDQPHAESAPRGRYDRPLLVGLGVALGALLVGGLALALRGQPPAAAPADATASAAAAVASIPPASTSSTSPEAATVTNDAGPAGSLPAQAEPFDLRTGFASLVGADEDAWQALAQAWGITLGGGDPCAFVRDQGIRCFRGAGITLTQIRQMDRPGILTLRDAGNRTAFAMLAGLSDDSAILRVEGRLRSVPLVTLADYWRGEFATFWRVPPDYAGAIVDSRSGPSARWLARELAAVRGETLPQGVRLDDATLSHWIHGFQLAQGLPSDGIAGPATLMQLNRVTGVDEPRLQTEP
jgi:general secretion pathway protein A